MWLHKNHNFGVNFLCPDGLIANQEVLFPLMDAQDTIAFGTGTINVPVKQMKTMVDIADLTGNATINLIIDAQVQKGAEIIIGLKSSATTIRIVTFGTGIIDSPAQISNTKRHAHFVFDGTSFISLSPSEDDSGSLVDIQTPAYNANIALNISAQTTIVNIAQLTGALALTVTISTGLIPGAHLLVKLQSDATARTTTPGAGFTGIAIAGTINKTKYASFIYDGTTFLHIGTNQVD